jgi:hypothetical protein
MRFYTERRIISTMLPMLSELLASTDLEGNVIMMAELISMFSSLGRRESLSGTNHSSTFMALTQILSQFQERLNTLSTMPERMVTSFMNVERDLENLELFQADVTAYGQMLYLNNAKKTFCRYCATGLQEILSSILVQSRVTQHTTLPRRPLSIIRPNLTRSNARNSTDSMNGFLNQESEDENDHPEE